MIIRYFFRGARGVKKIIEQKTKRDFIAGLSHYLMRFYNSTLSKNYDYIFGDIVA